MATVVKGKVEWGPRYTCPWNKWANGKTWRIKRGEDFHCPLERMRAHLHNRANKTGQRVRTKKESEVSLIFQFYEV